MIKAKAKLIAMGLLLMSVYSLIAYHYLHQLPESRSADGAAEPEKAEIAFLDVGQGDAILLQQGLTQILIDGGDGQEILNRLGETLPLGDKQIELLVATHPDQDHLGGLVKVMDSYQVEAVLETGIACDKDFCKKWEEMKKSTGVRELRARPGEEIKYGDNISLVVLYPFADLAGQEFTNDNEASLVMKAKVGGKRYLLTGDTEADTEQRLLASQLDLRADVLKVSHHGSKNATSAAFLLAVSPLQAVISVGENSYGHPSHEVFARLQNMNVEILRTDENGNIVF